MTDKPIHFRETRYGFEYGAATVERVYNHKGHVLLDIRTDRQILKVRVTPQGLIRFDEGGPQKVKKFTKPESVHAPR